ncbi:hypothetical protein V7024_24205 [Bacillus sp. JJ864]
MKKQSKQQSHYMRVYTLRDQSTKSIKVEPWRSSKDEMNVLGIKETDIY